ncbi:PREDICTED: sin3 histone deacetylase corepressor complex component SDS3-like [Amphimedon queenslandica]|uniref:Sin3 histone deacetylase corepressor complex component SDS3 n=1 Tax=Amphimedon queenslandica TaxID=400682 RepID=A0AAN0IUK9_AMPQE|nr:PREDICTED: sin3 histone deacetylase corepressor complex component SDS3-like [Amphimedon queenslandica]|eukprot:XP_011410137.1 PREDICTED: sin3 histone deacetylase corepressor complex component SDS3-like [Amphimedon queenslandica]
MEAGAYTAGKRHHSSTDEDTEDASEPELFKMDGPEGSQGSSSYKEKIAILEEHLKQVNEGTFPEYVRRLQELKELRDKRIFMAEIFKEYELNAAKEEYDRERSQAILECETKRSDLKDNLLMELQEKKKTVENLRSSMEITTGAYLFEPKMMVTRKLRRRNYESLPLPEKRRRSSPFFSTLVYELDENDIEEDLKYICKGKTTPVSSLVSGRPTVSAPAPSLTVASPEVVYDVRVEDGKLHYEGKSYGKNQHVIVESKERGSEAAVISSISHSEIIVKLLPEHAKLRIYLSHLSRGRYIIRKKNS